MATAQVKVILWVSEEDEERLFGQIIKNCPFVDDVKLERWIFKPNEAKKNALKGFVSG